MNQLLEAGDLIEGSASAASAIKCIICGKEITTT
jgi:hypothetical protein